MSWAELKLYLGDDFRPGWLPGGARLRNETIRRKGLKHYLRQSEERLYVEMSRELNGLREPYFQCVRETSPLCEVLEYQCGIGSDGIQLTIMGYPSAFAGESGRCMDFLKWRIEQRGLDARIYSLKNPPRFPLVVCLTTLDRIPSVERLAELGEIVALGVGPTVPGTPVDLAEYIAKGNYEIVKEATFNVIWHFIAFRTPEKQEEIDNG